MSLRHLLNIFAASVLMLAYLSSTPAQGTAQPVSINFDFRNGALGWEAGFADYPPGTDNGIYELKAEIRSLPPEITGGGTGFYMQGNNHSDDLFMFLKRRLSTSDGIVAGQSYEITFTLTLASNAPRACGGIGGSPGESLFLKTGASPAEPRALLDATRPSPNLALNVDKGNQTLSGIAASFAGDIATDDPCIAPTRFVSLQRTHRHTSLVTANSKGDLWLLVGTDSGFEGLTTFYYQSIGVRLVPVNTQPAPVLLTDRDTGRAAALDSVTLASDPFSVVNTLNFSQDAHTRVALFAYHLELRAGEDASAITVQAIDAQQNVDPLTVEDARAVHNFEWITQVVVRLPDELKNKSEVWLSVRLRGVESNRALIRLKASSGP